MKINGVADERRTKTLPLRPGGDACLLRLILHEQGKDHRQNDGQKLTESGKKRRPVAGGWLLAGRTSFCHAPDATGSFRNQLVRFAHSSTPSEKKDFLQPRFGAGGETKR